MAGRFLQRVRNNSNNHRLGKFIKLNNEQYLFKKTLIYAALQKKSSQADLPEECFVVLPFMVLLIDFID